MTYGSHSKKSNVSNGLRRKLTTKKIYKIFFYFLIAKIGLNLCNFSKKD